MSKNSKKEENSFILNFLCDFNELKYSFQEISFNKSFDKNIVEENIQLIKQKRYAISDDIWNIKEKENHQFLISLLELIGQYVNEFKNDIEKISKIFKEDISFSKEFILNILTNKQKKISEFIRNESLSLDFLTFYAIFAAYPYRESVSQLVHTKEKIEEHISGFCPICGHWPGMSYIDKKEGQKLMACICCGSIWSFRRLRCSFCHSADKDKLGYLNIEGEEAISAYTCDICRRYVKTKNISKHEAEISEVTILNDYMSSSNIDIAALQNKYLQEWIIGTRFDGPKDVRIGEYLKNS